ncbi:MAG: hotdog family protein [Planctomycetota bacterium]|jgi:3-hydroxyacyl-[acyl-carrier-protein] dehydratase
MKFRMVDRIVEFAPRSSICGVKTVSFEEYQLKSAFAGRPCLPESLIMESLFQLGNWLIILTSDFSQMGLVIRTNEIQFQRPLAPGQNMFMQVHVRSYRDDGILFDGQALVDQRVIVRGNGCLASPVDLAEYYDPENLKVLFSEIYRPDSNRGG